MGVIQRRNTPNQNHNRPVSGDAGVTASAQSGERRAAAHVHQGGRGGGAVRQRTPRSRSNGSSLAVSSRPGECCEVSCWSGLDGHLQLLIASFPPPLSGLVLRS
ncbi:hypothetical protein EYF80_067991 [Liparis tanakae]|uniref:Uncharacterized protein n=1 Tax=Liparis tanakae TaxID=230148 RepID=A0A4Z2DZM6_9TELE|nr:hypothetical protein EYF80_067991 [Liparis tanakae]